MPKVLFRQASIQLGWVLENSKEGISGCQTNRIFIIVIAVLTVIEPLNQSSNKFYINDL